MLRSYLRLVLFAVGLLLGVQVPGLINDYAHRVEAHLMEAQQTLHGFQDTADKFFNGDLQALVAHYRENPDPVFQADGQNVSALIERQKTLDAEWVAMQGPWWTKDWHVLTAADPKISQETLNGYTYQVLLVPEAIGWGVAVAFVLALVLECLVMLPAWTLYGVRRYKGEVPEHWR